MKRREENDGDSGASQFTGSDCSSVSNATADVEAAESTVMSTYPQAHMRSGRRRGDWSSLPDLLYLTSDLYLNCYSTVTRQKQDATTTTQGLALCLRCHLAWASEGTLVGPGKDTHGTPIPTNWEGRGWPSFTFTTRRVKQQPQIKCESVIPQKRARSTQRTIKKKEHKQKNTCATGSADKKMSSTKFWTNSVSTNNFFLKQRFPRNRRRNFDMAVPWALQVT